ncbi:MAG: hypothetical protein QOG46_2065, partial [Pseudonocardiales bacterium]|nr:hypothetical protein [Pseudonocardiales bacterium]
LFVTADGHCTPIPDGNGERFEREGCLQFAGPATMTTGPTPGGFRRESVGQARPTFAGG